jgi:hypothetical protein
VLGNYSPADNAALEGRDLDLGSTSPVLLAADVLAQGGKDALIRLLGIGAMAGVGPHTGNELQTVPSRSMMFTAPAVWRHGAETWMFAADDVGTAAWIVGNGDLTQIWSNQISGTSPVIAGDLLYVYDPNRGLHVYDPRSGTQIANLECGSGHWNSPIVVDGRIALPEGNANEHATVGVLDIWTLPTRQ